MAVTVDHPPLLPRGRQGAPGERDERVKRRRKDRFRMPRRGPHLGVPAQRRVHERDQLLRMPDRRDTPDRLPGVLPDERRVRLADPANPANSASRDSFARCAPEVSASSATSVPSAARARKTRLLAIAPTGTPSASAAWAAVRTSAGSTRTPSAAACCPASPSAAVTLATAGWSWVLTRL